MISNPQRWNAYPNGINNPLRYIDVDGRFSGYIHASLTQQAAWQKGYSFSRIERLIEANLNVDKLDNFFNNKEHGLRDASQAFNRARALRDIQAVIDFRRREAVRLALVGDYEGTLQELGQGLHTVQDLAAHDAGLLLFHGRETINDGDKRKRAVALTASKTFLTSFEEALISAAGREKAEEILNNIKESSQSDHKNKFIMIEGLEITVYNRITDQPIKVDPRSIAPQRAP